DTETVLALQGVLDATSVAGVRVVLEQLVVEGKPRVVIDVANLRLIDSTGVGAIVSAFKRLRAEGRQLFVRGARGQPLTILRLLRLDRIFLQIQANQPVAPGRAAKEAQLLVNGS